MKQCFASVISQEYVSSWLASHSSVAEGQEDRLMLLDLSQHVRATVNAASRVSATELLAFVRHYCNDLEGEEKQREKVT